MNLNHLKKAVRQGLADTNWAYFLPALAIALTVLLAAAALVPLQSLAPVQFLWVLAAGAVFLALVVGYLTRGKFRTPPASNRQVLTLELSADDLSDPLRRSLLWGVIEQASEERLDLHFKVPNEEDLPTLMRGLQDLLDEHDAETTLHKRVNLYSAPDTA